MDRIPIGTLCIALKDSTDGVLRAGSEVLVRVRNPVPFDAVTFVKNEPSCGCEVPSVGAARFCSTGLWCIPERVLLPITPGADILTEPTEEPVGCT